MTDNLPKRNSGSNSLVSRCAADVEFRPVRWLWKNRLVAGAINLLIGMPDVGKSVLTCDLAGRVTTGTNWPTIDGESGANQAGSVIFLAAEDSPETTLIGRLKAASADLERVHFIDGVTRDTADGIVRDQFDIQRDVAELRKLHRLMPDLRLVIVDPLDSFISTKTDTNVGNQSRAALWPLKDWAEETGVTVAVVHHFNKSTSTNAMDKVSGARSFCAMPRSVWAVGRDPNDDGRTIMAPIKLNLVKASEKRAIAYRIMSSTENPDHPFVEWCDKSAGVTAGDIVAGSQTRKTMAAEWLRQTLAAGPMDAKELLEHAAQAGHSMRTLNRAKEEARVVTEQKRDGSRIEGWLWTLAGTN